MSIEFILLALTCTTLPGLAACRLLNIKQNRTLHSIALSYCIFFIVFSLFSALQILEQALSITILSILIASASLILLTNSVKSESGHNLRSALYLSGIFVATITYNYLFGAASDLPSDLYAHLERFQRALSDLSDDDIDSGFQSVNWLRQGYGWYYFLAVIAGLTNATSAQVLESTNIVTNTLLFTSLFAFSRTLFQQHRAVTWIALFVCLFTAVHMGISIFAFSRYYALGPVMIGFCIYFAAVRYFLDSLIKQSLTTTVKHVVIMLIYIFVCVGNHTQEALFILTMLSIMTMILSYRQIQTVQYIKRLSWSINAYTRRLILIILSLLIVASCAVYFHTIISSDRSIINDSRLWHTPEFFGVFPSFTLLNFSNQFIQVITLWGCVVYLLFILNYQRYKQNTFIVAGMLSPLCTIFNPLFVDLFLNHKSFTTLWRLSYLVTIHFVAADIFIHYWQQVRQATLIERLFALTLIGLLIGLLLPIGNTWQGVHYSRLPTLTKTGAENSYRYYDDLISFLNTQEKNTVVTDPITGYLVAAMTYHHSPRKKFFVGPKYNHFSFHRYDQNTLKKYQGHLLLVNKRTQASSQVGKLSGHWPENQLKQIHSYYPQALIEHISTYPKQFDLLWSNNGISLYRIN